MATAISPGVYMEPRRKAILCLCYDTTMLKVRQMLLEHFGYTVWPTHSVEEATAVASDRCPDMLLMDNNHPGVDLEQVAQQVKSACPTLIAVVLAPYYYGSRDGTAGAVDCFVAKDDGPDALISQINNLLGDNAEGGKKPTHTM